MFQSSTVTLNELRQRQNGRHFTDNIFKCIIFNKTFWIVIQISLKFVSKGPMTQIMAQIMAWCQTGDTSLTVPMMVKSAIHITQPQWINSLAPGRCENIFTNLFFKHILRTDIWSTSCEICLNWVPQNPTDDRSALVHVMAWCHQATSHYLSQSWPRCVVIWHH